MDSSINYAKPYVEKKPPRRKAPVRNPRPKKEPVITPIIKSLISPVERAAIKAGQTRLIAGETINQAIKGSIARRALKNVRANKAMNTAGDVLKSASIINRALKGKIARNAVAKMKASADKVEVPIPKPKKERKARSARAPKPVYKISYAAALKEWNMSHNTGMYCNPRKGSDEYKAVQALRL